MSKDVGRKDDAGKLRFDLVQWKAFAEYVAVLTHGSKKYAPHNWRKVDDAKNRYIAAAFRHFVVDWLIKGKVKDDESGLHPLSHALCCIMFLLERELEGWQ